MSLVAIDEAQLETDLPYRFRYLAEFIGFTAEDAAAIQASGPHLGPLIPQMVERVYEKLLKYEATARHFLPRQSGYAGAVPANLADVRAAHPQVQFRKEHLSSFFMQILGRTLDERLVTYLDMVGKIHTPRAGNREISVPLVQMNALMGYLADVLGDVIASLAIDAETKLRTIRAFSKLLWIQNDFITRHYAT